MRNCPSCEKSIPDGVPFCLYCGQELSSASPAPTPKEKPAQKQEQAQTQAQQREETLSQARRLIDALSSVRPAEKEAGAKAPPPAETAPEPVLKPGQRYVYTLTPSVPAGYRLKKKDGDGRRLIYTLTPNPPAGYRLKAKDWEQQKPDAGKTEVLDLHETGTKEQKQKAGQPAEVRVGDVYTFGAYWQKADKAGGKTPIAWRVLAREENRALLISRLALDRMPFHQPPKGADQNRTGSVWAISTLREWLNGEFYREAFNAEEQRRIVTSTVGGDKNPNYGTFFGGSTKDKVFILSASEAEFYFKDANERACGMTAYTAAKGDAVKTGNCFWWLRTPGKTGGYIARVNRYGTVSYVGDPIYDREEAVRPAVWVTLPAAPEETGTAKKHIRAGKGDVVALGSYPQTRVTDPALLAALNAAPKNWVSCRCYAENRPGDYMRCADISLGGGRYRAVTFDEYCPRTTEGKTSAFGKDAMQRKNGYKRRKVYYFRFEPLRWRVLDPARGLALCENVVDQMHYAVTGRTYAVSDLREWLNGSFYALAFNNEERAFMKTETHENLVFSPLGKQSAEEDAATADRVFALSLPEALDAACGFGTELETPDNARAAKGTDYAKCRGAYASEQGFSLWFLRTRRQKRGPVVVNAEGVIRNSSGAYDYKFLRGVRPAVCLNLKNS